MPVKLYGSVNGQAKEIRKLYGSVSGLAKPLQKLYGSINGQTKLIYQNYGEVKYYIDNTYTTTAVQYITDEADIASLCNVGLTWNASINGVTIPNSMIKEVDLSRSTLTTLGMGFLARCHNLTNVHFPPLLISLGNLALLDCPSFNGELIIPSGLTTIPIGFMNTCTSFNQPLIFPSGTISISGLAGITSFNHPVTIPDTVTSIGGASLYNWDSMVQEVNIGNLSPTILTNTTFVFVTENSAADCYTTGIKIAGANRAAWLAALPNSSVTPYRHLIDAGH